MNSKDSDSLKKRIQQKSILCIHQALKENITENDVVTFDLEPGKKGLNAVNVKLA